MQKDLSIQRRAVALIALMLLPGWAMAQLNDTGQSQCTDSAGMVIDCMDAASHPGQDARYGRDARAAAGRLSKHCDGVAGFDFCALDDNGVITTQADPPCMADQVTGLIWSTETLAALDWADANAVGATQARCGIDAGWRLPTRRELLSIVDHGVTGPAIDAAVFPDTLNAAYWSADAYAADPAQAWTIDFIDGDTLHVEQTQPQAARLVVSSANQPPRITLGANIIVPREDRPVPLSFPGWATGIAPGPPREAGQHLTATLRLLSVTDQKALEFDVPPVLDPATGTLSFTIKQRTYPENGQNTDDPDYDMWYSAAGLARVELTLQDDGGTANGGVDSTTVEFSIFLDPVPVSRDIGIKHPWKAACIPITLGSFDADTDPVSDAVWPRDPWPFLLAGIVTYPQKGYITDYVAAMPTPAPIPGAAKAGDDDVSYSWLMWPTTPIQHDYWGRFNYNVTFCYVPFSSTFVGSDTFTYRVMDADGNISNTASVSIEIFEK
ncbi:MAG TPA: DUF1566 domain-containing protein [Rhodanobacteraceae bacterium]|nr:DUF1566 domain-containing protein [Rhodanobacteraceae bacterium]